MHFSGDILLSAYITVSVRGSRLLSEIAAMIILMSFVLSYWALHFMVLLRLLWKTF